MYRGLEAADRASRSRETDKDMLAGLYRCMLRIRLFEEKVEYFFSKSAMHGTTHLYIGEEAIAAGAMSCLSDEDYITSTHRCHGHAIAKGSSLGAMMAEFMGRKTGLCRGKGGSMHVIDLARGNLGGNGIVAGGIPLAVGAALSIKLQKKDRVVLCFFGDGATNEGAFHEAVNLASIWKLPIVFICENNHYAMSTPLRKAVNVKDLALRAEAYGIPGENVDGMDVLAVREAVGRALRRAKSKGPSLLVASTYRFKGHSKSDENKYRSQDEIETWKLEDPIPRFRRFLLREKAVSEEELSLIEAQAAAELDEAVRYAQSSPEPGPEELELYVYAE